VLINFLRANADVFAWSPSESGSAPEDDELRSARPQGSDSGSAPEDDNLRSARPQGSDSGSAPEDDELRSA
jgi:hypothetical protein